LFKCARFWLSSTFFHTISSFKWIFLCLILRPLNLQTHCDEQDQTDGDILVKIRKSAHDQSVLDTVHDQDTDKCQRQVTPAAAHDRTADNSGGNGLHDDRLSHESIGSADTACVQHACEGSQRIAQQEAEDLHNMQLDAADLGTLGIAADR